MCTALMLVLAAAETAAEARYELALEVKEGRRHGSMSLQELPLLNLVNI